MIVSPTAEAEIRELMDSYVGAIRSADVDRFALHYTPDIPAFDAIAHQHWSAPFDPESFKALLDLKP